MTAPADPVRILIVDQAGDRSARTADLIRRADGWSQAVVEFTASFESAVYAFDRTAFDFVLVEDRVRIGDGLGLLPELRRAGIEAPVVVLTSGGVETVAVDAMRAGAADCLSSPQLSTEILQRTLRHALALSAETRQRRQAEEKLRASEERCRALVESSPDALILVDAHGCIGYTTVSSERHVGWAAGEMAGRPILDLVHPDDREAGGTRLAEALRRPGEPVRLEVRLRHADGSWRTVEGIVVNRLNEPTVDAVVINVRDVTERRRLEQQLRQGEKMEAVGRLAGGIAHEFNNVLTAVLGYCNLILEEVPSEDPICRDLQEIRAAGSRAAILTRQLLAFSRRQMLQPQILDLDAVLRQMDAVLRRLLGEDVELVTAFAADGELVKVDPASIEQVLVNLAVNARDAMPTGGRVTIETAVVTLDAAYAKAHVAVEPGRYLMMAVGDTGEGMDSATVARVFEPFFTTKGQGRGIGLGLATVYGIVKQSGGYIWVYSEPHHGTVFKVYLPVANAPAEERPAEPAASSEGMRGWETVLLVEDEVAVRKFGAEVLRRHGYVVLEAGHGLDALRLAERHQDRIHLMITDVVMPHLSGSDLAQRFGNLRPNMKVLFMSGYTDHTVVPRELAPGSAFLQKPFSPADLVRTVRRVLDLPS